MATANDQMTSCAGLSLDRRGFGMVKNAFAHTFAYMLGRVGQQLDQIGQTDVMVLRHSVA